MAGRAQQKDGSGWVKPTVLIPLLSRSRQYPQGHIQQGMESCGSLGGVAGADAGGTWGAAAQGIRKNSIPIGNGLLPPNKPYPLRLKRQPRKPLSPRNY